jgi:hypothetical protein
VIVDEWTQLPSLLESYAGSRETVHHIVEANLVASNLILAALGADEPRYEWSWMVPDERWMQRLGYANVPIAPAIALLRALTTHIAALLDEEKMTRRLRFVGSDEVKTVEEILRDEVEHARRHLAEVSAAVVATCVSPDA